MGAPVPMARHSLNIVLSYLQSVTAEESGAPDMSRHEKPAAIRIPKALQGLAAEAQKCDSFEEFEKDFLHDIKHGTYWHWTDDPDFKIDPSKGPRDMSSLSTGREDTGKLMVTSHLDAWSDYGPGGKGRPYAALIDMSDVPRNMYRQVNRGFGNEFFVWDPSKAKVTAVYPRRRAFQVDRERKAVLPQNAEELREFYDRVKGQAPLEGQEGAQKVSSESDRPTYTHVPDRGSYPAIRTYDGELYVDTDYEGRTHVMFAKHLGISPLEIESGGWMRDGVYDPSARSDVGRWAEQERARKAVSDRRPAGGAPQPSHHKIVSSYLKSAAIDLQADTVKKISPQEISDRRMFGPVWHGTGSMSRERIEQEGFKVFVGVPREGEISHGYEKSDYYMGIPAPVHHLGYGVYFTTVKAIARNFAGGSMAGMKTYYLDVPRLEIINFGANSTMMKWWIANGYDPELAKVDRVAATVAMTNNLKSKWDAVWFKGKGIRRLLDGDQICVYDPSRIYQVEHTLSKPGELGSKVRRKSDGMIGVLEDIRPIPPDIAQQYHGGEKQFLSIKWKRGGRDFNVYPKDVDFLQAG